MKLYHIEGIGVVKLSNGERKPCFFNEDLNGGLSEEIKNLKLTYAYAIFDIYKGKRHIKTMEVGRSDEFKKISPEDFWEKQDDENKGWFEQ